MGQYLLKQKNIFFFFIMLLKNASSYFLACQIGKFPLFFLPLTLKLFNNYCHVPRLTSGLINVPSQKNEKNLEITSF